ncbi:MAG: hypothetical protein F6K19_48600, partial [Cyanothece sp. SIO1E1]|nr:hypothetical protein [Cyanothece sp. SIO1E1]
MTDSTSKTGKKSPQPSVSGATKSSSISAQSKQRSSKLPRFISWFQGKSNAQAPNSHAPGVTAKQPLHHRWGFWVILGLSAGIAPLPNFEREIVSHTDIYIPKVGPMTV